MITKLVSGGQTGADRAALDFAIRHAIAHGGWCPRGRRAEDGTIPERYQLVETPGSEFRQRTEWNVRDSDATVIITLGEVLAGGSKVTAEFAEALGKPWLRLSRLQPDPALRLRRFVEGRAGGTLNVAGPRESDEPGIYDFVSELLQSALCPPDPRG